MSILLLGKTGQTGFELHRTLSPLGTISAPGRDELNLLDHQAVNPYLVSAKPTLIVNAAANKARLVPTSDYPTPAKRPRNSRMDVAKLEQALNIQLPTWQCQLELTLGEYLEK